MGAASMFRGPDRILDEYLVVLGQAGSVETLDQLARQWTPRLLRYAMTLLSEADPAQRPPAPL